MSAFLTKLSADRIVWMATLASLGLCILSLVYIFILYRSLPPFLPLFNQMAWGEPRLGEKPTIFLLPLLTFALLIGNTIFTSIIYDHMPLVARMLSVTSFLLSLISLIFLFRITQLVI